MHGLISYIRYKTYRVKIKVVVAVVVVVFTVSGFHSSIESNFHLFRIDCITTVSDWLKKKTRATFHPIRSKTKINCNSLAHVGPAAFSLVLIGSMDCLTVTVIGQIDYRRFWLYGTQSKTAHMVYNTTQ